MKAYIWKTRTLISPFMDAVGDALICNITLEQRQRQTLQAEGFEVVETDDPACITDSEFLLVRDDLYFCATALRRFLAASAEAQETCACALQQGPFTDFTQFLQDLRSGDDAASGARLMAYGLYRCRGPVQPEQLMHSVPLVRIEAKQSAKPIEAGSFLPETMEVTFTPAFSDATLLHVRHWTHLWLLNLLVLVDTLRKAFTSSKLKLILRVLSAFSLQKHKIAQRFVIKGKGCKIHPTAMVQGCILGDNVQIGAFSMVQGCILGNGVQVGEQSILTGSVFGDGVMSCPRGWSKLCVIYPGTRSGRIQASLIGRNVFLSSIARLLDIKFGGTIKVPHQGRVEDTGMNFLGACVGHESRLGAGVWLAAGRDIPNGTVIVKNAKDVYTRSDDELPESMAYWIEDGRLVPVGGQPAAADTTDDGQLPDS